MDVHERYMSRCLQLARHALGHAAPNPMVGAVLVHDGRIIGEGRHRYCGGAHAEVECLDSVTPEDRTLIPASTLYVSLEPCAHQGRTPPCADRIVREGIRRVFVGCRDPFALVDGRGIERLRSSGVDVTCGVLAQESERLSIRFLRFHLDRRPYVILKWAQSQDGMVAGPGGKPLRISSPSTDRLVHLWRSQESAIFVGSGTARIDDPRLTARIPGGRNPLRVVVDRHLALPRHLHLFDAEAPTLVCNLHREGEKGNLSYARLADAPDLLPGLLDNLHRRQVQSILVEGGVQWLRSFLDSGLWDEARVITAMHTRIPGGLPAPQASWPGGPDRTLRSGNDRIDFHTHPRMHG
jgi:diaminohydroxyphosphoribosylaminopyrimidine deaminase/5-amino-6-(5-phosphoribosylamino)uracil reductase